MNGIAYELKDFDPDAVKTASGYDFKTIQSKYPLEKGINDYGGDYHVSVSNAMGDDHEWTDVSRHLSSLKINPQILGKLAESDPEKFNQLLKDSGIMAKIAKEASEREANDIW